jgi:signal transduction histidine kinase
MNQSPKEAKDDFLALASHQLRTPATGVKQYLGMLIEGYAGPLSELQEKLLNKAYSSNERQLSIINEMLFVARADSGQIKIQEDLIDLQSLIKDTVEEQQLAFFNKEQTFKINIPEEKVLFVGDEQYLRMAIENLISNATKYTPEGGHIDIFLKQSDSSIKIEVSDTGVGVSEEDKKLLFRKFTRIPNDLTGLVNGSGLGLYLVKKVIETHGGTVEFESEEGIGSTVKIILPNNKPS